MPVARRQHGSARSQGFTLVEVLVAMLVLSVGVLGVASLQVTGYRYNHTAQLYSQAALLANDIVERMRANRVDAAAGNYDILLSSAAPTAGDCLGAGKDCSIADLRDFDRSQWLAALAARLPAGDGAISTDTTVTPATVTVTVQFDDSRGAGTPTQSVFNTRL